MAKKKSPEKSPEQIALEKEVRKNRHRIKEFIRKATKRGFVFPDNIVPSLPKTITDKTLNKFRKYTPEYLYKKAVYVSPIGTKIKGTARRKQERSEVSKRAAETRRKYVEEKQRAQKERVERWYEQELNQILEDEDREAQAIVPKELPELPTEGLITDDYFITEDTDDYEGEDDEGIYDYTEDGEPIYYDDLGDPDVPPEYADAGEKIQRTDVVLQMLLDMLNNWEPSDKWSEELKKLKTKDKKLLETVVYSIINAVGRTTVAINAEKNASVLTYLFERVLYSSGKEYRERGIDGINEDIQRIAAILRGRSLTVAESKEYGDISEVIRFNE